MTQLHFSFQTVMQRRIIPAFMIALAAGVFLRLLIPRAAPFKVIIIAVVLQMIVCLVHRLSYQMLVSNDGEGAVVDRSAGVRQVLTA